MRKVILYIAVSLDGYIADGKGAVDWIGGHDENVEKIPLHHSSVAWIWSLWEERPTTKL